MSSVCGSLVAPASADVPLSVDDNAGGFLKKKCRCPSSMASMNENETLLLQGRLRRPHACWRRITAFLLGRIHTRAVWSALNGLEFVSADSPLRLGRCECASELWCGPNKRTLVCLKTWVSVRLQVNPGSVRMQCESLPDQTPDQMCSDAIRSASGEGTDVDR